MALFRYRALAPSGEQVVGEMEAQNQATVISRLQDKSLLPVEANPVSHASIRWWDRALFERKGFSSKQLGLVTRQLARLVRAGLPLERCLELLILVAQSKGVEQALTRILNGVRGGATLAEALEKEGRPFDPMFISMVRAGEAGSSLTSALERLSDHQEQARNLRASVASAMIYPAILVAVSLASLVILLAFVVPQFQPLFDNSNQALPFSTTIVIWLAELLQNTWWLLLVLTVLTILMLPPLLRVPPVRRVWHSLLLGLPLFGNTVRKVEVARFTRTLGTLLTNGVPLLNALIVVRGTLVNSVIADAVDRISERLTAGEGLSGPLQDANVFPPLAVHMVRVGEETARLDELLVEVAEILDSEVRQDLKTILAFLEPALILVLGLMVGGIVVSILVAILSVNDLAL